MACSRRSILDRLLWLRYRSGCGSLSDVIPDDILGGLLRKSDLMDHIVSPPSAAATGIDSSARGNRADISTQAFFTFGLACFTGSLFDKYGHKPLIASGTFFLVLGFCMLSLCTKYYQLFLVHATLLAWGCNLL